VRGTSKTEDSSSTKIIQETSSSDDFVRGRPSRAEKKTEDLGSTDNIIQETDFLFSKSHREKQQKKRSKQGNKDARGGSKSAGSDGTLTRTQKNTSIEPISFKTLHPGVKLLGTIRDVTAKDAVVSLPNALTGYLSLKEVSDYYFGLDPDTLKSIDLRDILHVGDYLRCVVRKLSGSPKSRVDLTTRASVVNKGVSFENLGSEKGVNAITGHIKSIEDRGYVVSLGMQGVNGFLPFKNLEEEDRQDREGGGDGDGMMILGSPISCVVEKIKEKAKVVTLTRVNWKTTMLRSTEDVALNSLLPGTLVQCSVERVMGRGVTVRFLTFFTGTMDIFHTPKIPTAEVSLDSFLAKGDKLVARVIKVDLEQKSIALSALPHVLLLKPKKFTVAKGDILPSARVSRADRDLGLYLTIPMSGMDGNDEEEEKEEEEEEEKGGKKSSDKKEDKMEVDSSDSDSSDSDEEETTSANKQDAAAAAAAAAAATPTTFAAYAHISKLADGRVDNVLRNKTYSIHTEHMTRVLGFSEFDGNVLVTLRPSTIATPFFGIQDVIVGADVIATVSTVNEKQMILLLGERVRASCTSMHFSDIHLSDPIKFFQVGAKIKVRVLSVDQKTKRVRVTHKKSLVKSKLPTIQDYSPAPNLVTHGFVSDIKDYGVMVTFLNNVYGLVPVSMLEKSGASTSSYTKGQVVRVRVVRCESEKRRIRLSFDTTAKAKKRDATSGAR